ncbi:MAG: VOC family protein [Acidimicrobiaceae bacterium]|nr:VOC family protein [Acidimicrobiia bacterium]MCY4493887.1 VOC family protein [Acidimicrobiaceae bacterium]
MANHGMQIDYVELPAPAFEDSKRFYSRVFGWEWTQYGPAYAACEGGSVEVGLNGGAVPAPAHAQGAEDSVGPLALLSCDDLGAKEADIAAAGGVIVSQIYPYPGGRRFHFSDPSGNILGVYQPDPL